MSSAIQRHALETPDFESRLDHALALLRDAAAQHAGRIVLTTSLGAEDMVLTELIARHRLPVALATLETGKLHAETLALLERVEAHYGVAVERWQPHAEQVLNFVARHGEMAMRESVELRKACCSLRKVQPLDRAFEGRSAWITGLRREQSGSRALVPFRAMDDAGREKISPLADWSWHDVWHFIALFKVPYNPLHDQFYPSIGCEPCTRGIAAGEDIRAGRWWWEQAGAKECGLHEGAPLRRRDSRTVSA